MSRLLNLLFLTAMLTGAIVTYEMKRQAENSADHVRQLERKIASEKDAIQLLRAELSMLLQPSRLQAVVERYPDHFKLEDFTPKQYATVDEIQFRPLVSIDEETNADPIPDSDMTIR